ncbi:uncharacterized protein LOC124843072 [Vigna umbellata]|uniref:uncharacterized protein LOC124843072 n=1 Tax=Vigna umbellata TaxID=87088 RepID=UPI001F5F9A38|nr:uncharacterized protein LOC124843072 [Vigna umbellata]
MEHKALWALKFMNFDPSKTQNKRKRQMLELEEMRLKLFPRKLKSNWSGPFIVKSMRTHGEIELVDPSASDQQRSWVVNGQRLKLYLEGEVERLSIVMKLVDP